MAPRAAEEDRLLRDLQGQWGMVGLAIAQGVIRLEETISSIIELVDTSVQAVAEYLAALQETLSDHAAPPASACNVFSSRIL